MLYDKVYCEKNNLRYSQPRESVYKCLYQAKAPLTAYDIIYKMGVQEGKTVNPPTVYRAIDFLIEQGLIHKIDSLKSYVLCNHDHVHEGVCFIKCKACKNVYENLDYKMPLDFKKDLSKLDLDNWQLEINVKSCEKCA